jgi:hypothetical protein
MNQILTQRLSCRRGPGARARLERASERIIYIFCSNDLRGRGDLRSLRNERPPEPEPRGLGQTSLKRRDGSKLAGETELADGDRVLRE